MRKFPKFSAMLAAAVILPSLFSAIPAEAAIYSAPTLKSPTSNQTLTNYPRNTSFSWNAVSGAKSYKLEVACDVCVSKTTKWQGAKTYTVSGTSYSVKMLGDNEYRWRVRAVDSSSNLGPWSGYSYFKYRTGSSNNDTTTIPTISYPVNGASYNLSVITYDWTDVSSATKYNYILQRLNSSSNVWTTVKESATSGSTSNVSLSMSGYTGGQFRFRAQAVYSGSVTSGWSAWRYFYDNKDGGSQTSSVTITYPAEGQTVYSSTNHVIYRWNSVVGASNYVIQYTTGLYHQQTLQTTVADNYFDFYATYNDDDFSFRVKAINGSGTDITPWSGWRNYYMSDDSDDNNDTFTVYSPTEDQTFSSHDVSINWSNVSGATSYEVNVNYYQDSSWVNQGTYTAYTNPYSLTFYNDNNYRLRVRAVFSGYTYGNWSDWREFVVDADGTSYYVGTPTLVSPADGATVSQDYVNLDWSNVTGATSYEYEVTKYNGSSWESIRRGNISASDATVTLPYGDYGQYSLHVRAIKNGSYGSWSEYHQFYYSNGSSTTGAPAIYSPYENQAFSGHDVSINWSNVSGATSYEVNVNYYQDDSWVNQGTYTVYTNPYSLTLYNNNNYRLRVRAVPSGSTYGNWSDWREFVVAADNYSKPTITFPSSNGQTFHVETIIIQWPGNAPSYDYELEKYNASSGNWEDKESGAVTYSIGHVLAVAKYGEGQYRFRTSIHVFSSGNYSDWSDWRDFYLYNATITTAPTISQPTENQVISGSNVNFTWNNISGVSQYVVMVKPNEFTAQVTGGYAYYTANQNSYIFTATGNVHKYMAKVCLMFGPNQYGACSPTRYFELNPSSSYTSGAPTIYSPYEDQTLSNHNVNIDWSDVSGAASYEVNVNYYQDGSWVNQGTYTAYQNPYSLTLYNDDNYRLRIRAVFSGYTYGNWSDWREFVVGTGGGDGSYNYEAPTVYTPNAGVTYGTQVYTYWSANGDAESYKINVQYKTGSYWYEERTQTVSGATSVILTFGNDNDYRLRVQTVFPGGSVSSWSEWREFGVDGNSDDYSDSSAPTVYDPYNGETFTSDSVYMSWSTISGAVSYEVEIDYKSGSYWYDEGTYSTSYQNYTKVFYSDNDYRMRVRAKYSGGTYTSWSNWYEFTVDETGGYDYSPPTISEPENNETFTAETVYIGWTSVYTAVSYEIEIDYKSGSNWYDEGTYTTSNLYYIKTFSGDNNYRVRARAKFSDNSYTNWSAWREFVVNAD